MQLMEIMLLKYCSVSFGLLFGISLRNLISLSSNPNIWKPQNSNKVLENHFKKRDFWGDFFKVVQLYEFDLKNGWFCDQKSHKIEG